MMLFWPSATALSMGVPLLPGLPWGGGRGTEVTPREMEVIETECVQVMLGMIAMQGGILSKDLRGLHAVRDKQILLVLLLQ